jgi:hypothetical protein
MTRPKVKQVWLSAANGITGDEVDSEEADS